MAALLYTASAFNVNLAAWNVLSTTAFGAAFDSTTALSDCNKKAMYTAWGATLMAAYSGWSSLCATASPTLSPTTLPTETPTATPSTATPRYPI